MGGLKNCLKATIVLWCLFVLGSEQALSQNVKTADSLINMLPEISSDSQRLQVLRRIAINASDPGTIIKYSEELLTLAKQSEAPSYVIEGLHNLGIAYQRKGDLDKSIEYLYEAASLANEINDQSALAFAYSELSTSYAKGKDYLNSLRYNNKAISAFRELGDIQTVAITLLNTGYQYYNLGIYDTAIIYYNEAEPLLDSIGLKIGVAYAIGNRALVEWKTGETSNAIYDLKNAIGMLAPLGDEYGMADYYNQLGNIYFELGDFDNASINLTKGVNMASNIDLKEQVRDGSKLLAEIYRKQNNTDSAFIYLYQYVSMRDSIASEEIIQALANQRADFEIQQKQVEVDLLMAQKRNQQIVTFAIGGFAFILLILALIIFKYYQSKARINKILEEQKHQLEINNETKDKFFSIISHDLRGPIAALSGVSHLIRHFVELKQENALIEMAGHMEQSVDQLSSLLDNLLNWAMQQQGHFPHIPEKVDISSMMNDIVAMYSNMAAGKKIDLSHGLEEDLHLWVDRNSVHTILRNLVNNAIKFTNAGGSVTITSEMASDKMHISITDSGVGMDQARLDTLFKLSGEKSSFGTAGEKGLGLGLQLVQEFVQMNNGSIEAKSELGKGTTFIVTLPLFEPEEELIRKPSKA